MHAVDGLSNLKQEYVDLLQQSYPAPVLLNGGNTAAIEQIRQANKGMYEYEDFSLKNISPDPV